MPSTITDRASGLGTGATPNGENATVSQKVPCRAATVENITLSGLQTIDTVTLAASDRVLVKNQTDASQNGIYLASPDVWQRTADCVDAGDLVRGSQVRVNEGAVGPGTWYCIAADPIAIGADDNTWVDTASTDLSGAEIKALYEAESNTNAYTDIEQTKVGHLTVTQAVNLDQMEIEISALSDGMVYKGTWDASAGTFPGAGSAQTGWFYYVSIAGTVDSIDFAVGDNLVATTDNASSTVFTANWSKHDQTPTPFDDVDYDTKSALEAADVTGTMNLVRIAGYATVGDGGAAGYRRVVSEPSHNGKIQSNDGAWWELAESRITPQMFGAVADGATNALAAFASALVFVSGSTLYVPAGSYQLDFTTTTALDLPENTSIVGEGREATTLTFDRNTDSFRNLFTTSDGVSISGVTIAFTNDGNASNVIFFSLTSSQFTLKDCAFHGGMTNTGPTLVHEAFLVSFPESGTQEDITVQGCKIARFAYAFLKTNTSTAEDYRIKVLNNDFYENYRADCSFNSPAGACTDVLVEGNTFRNNLGSSASLTNSNLCAFASVTDFRCVNNDYRDTAEDVIHIEEACRGGVVSNNTINVDCARGISLADNNIAGSYSRPSDIVITGNRIKKGGTQKEAPTFGIVLVNNGVGINATEKVVASDNIIEGFQRGLFLQGTETTDGIEVAGNFITNCTRGLEIGYDTGSLHDNTTKICDVGVYASNGAVVLRHRFMGDVTPVDAVQRPTVLVDPVFVYSSFAVSAASTVNTMIVAMSSNSRMYGIGYSYANTESTAQYSSIATEFTWDGATLTQTAKATIQPGSTAVTFDVFGGYFRFRTFSTLAVTTARISFKLNGSMTIAV